MTSSDKDFVFGRHAGLDYLKTQDADHINKIFLQQGIKRSEEHTSELQSLV